MLGGVQKAALLPGEDVVILGAGPAGLVYMKVFQAAGAGQVIAVEVSPWRIEFARRAGADRVIDPSQQDLREAVQAVTDGGAHVVVDAVGSQLTAAVSVARRGGGSLSLARITAPSAPSAPGISRARSCASWAALSASRSFPKQ